MLVEPVGHEAADDAVVPPARRAHGARPSRARCSSRRARRGRRRSSPWARWRAASGCAAPTTTRGTGACTPRSRAIVSPGGTAGSRRERMNSRSAGGTSSAYTWSPSRTSACGHVLRVAAAHVVGEHAQGVDLAAARILVLAQGVRRIVRGAHAAGAPGDPERRVGAVRADHAGRERASPPRGQTRSPSSRTSYGDAWTPARGPCSARARSGGPRRANVRCAAAEHLDLAGRVRLDPDRRLRLARVAEERPEDEAAISRPARAARGRRA